MIALVLNGPNRFDRDNNGINLGPAGDLCRETFAAHGIDYDTEVWTTFTSSFFTGDRPAGKISRIIFAGPKPLEYLAGAKGKTLDAYRGVVYQSSSKIPYISTYWPQDCCDARAVEDELAGVDGDDGDDTDGDGKSTSPTKRTNYRFWFQRDVAKLLAYDASASALPEPKTCFVENTRDALNVFSFKGDIFFDIECNPKNNQLLCLAIACGDNPVYSIPVYDWTGNLCVGPAFFAALVREMSRRRIVVHNALFDLCFLAAFYHLPFGKDIYCTMVAGHRIWPEAEKSLAHQQTLYANRPFHKDESGTFDPRNKQQFDQLRAYNVKDVVALREIYMGQLAYTQTDRGLRASVEQAMDSLWDYGFMSLHGLEYNEIRRQSIIKQCERRHKDLQRVLDILVGKPLNPGSPDQVVRYLHGALGYKPEKTTDSGSPSVAGDALYKIKIKNPFNVAIDVIFEMRRMTKLKGMLGFQNWIWEY